MDEPRPQPQFTTPPANLDPIPKKSWFSAHHALGYIFLFTAVAAIVAAFYYNQTIKQMPQAVDLPVHKDATANWKTYTNAEYGFEMKLPPGWTQNKEPNVSEDSILINFASDEERKNPQFDFYGGSLSLTIYENPDNKTLEQFLGKDGVMPGILGDATGGHKDLLIDKRKVKRLYDVVGYYTAQILVIHDGNRIIDITADDSELINGIVSSFKFIEIVDTSTWKTYTNAEYGFEFKYPNNWNYEERKEYGLCFRENGKTYIVEESDVCGVYFSVDKIGTDSTDVDSQTMGS